MHHHTDGDLTSFNIIAASALLLTGLISWFYLIPGMWQPIRSRPLACLRPSCHR